MDFERKKILVMTDSPKIDTGFGRVGREVWSYLVNTGKYEVHCIGWFHQENNREVPYQVYTTRKDGKGIIIQEDKYSHQSFPGYVEKIKPDLVWTLGDMWMVDHVKDAPNRDTFKWVGYFPIDGLPVPSKWGQVIEDMDVAVAYGKFGMDVISQRAPKANLRYIYHGVNCRTFTPATIDSKKDLKQRLLGIDNKTVIGIVARNQPRKAFDKLFKAFYHILYGEYVRCKDCGSVTVSEYDLIERLSTLPDKCCECNGTNIKKCLPKDDVILYLHCAPKDCGWDLIDLQDDFNLKGNIIFNPDLHIGRGVPENTLASIYNAIDIFTLPTRGEGFGLPILEAMACGLPVVATDYSAHPEWSKGVTSLVKPCVLESEPLTNIRRAVIDINKYVEALVDLIENKSKRTAMGKKARERAMGMDWKIINDQWEDLIDSVLFPDGAPEKIEVTDLKFKLEEM